MARRSCYLGNGPCAFGFSLRCLSTSRVIYSTLPHIGAFTIIGWAYLHSLRFSDHGDAPSATSLVGMDTSDDTAWALIGSGGGAGAFQISSKGPVAGSVDSFWPSDPAVGSWFAFALVGSGDTNALLTGYFIPSTDPGDGSTMVTQAISSDVTASGDAAFFRVGRASTVDAGGFTEWSDASFSNVMLYSSALTSAQVKAQMISTTSAPIITSNLFGWYRLDSTDWGADSSGNSHPLTIEGLPIDGPPFTFFTGDTQPQLPIQRGIRFAGFGAHAVSAANGTSIAPNYPSPVAAGDLLVLFVAQRPPTASPNTGTLTTPSGWTLQASLTGTNDGNTGGYSAAIATDTGNMNVYVLTKVATGSESGTLTLTVSGSTGSVAYASIFRFVNFSKKWSIASTTGKDITTGAAISVTFAGDPGVKKGDEIFAGFVVPTDVDPFNKYTAWHLAQTGVVYSGESEVQEYFESNGLDIGGLCVHSPVDSGVSSAAPVLTATAGGTTLNMRGPGVFLRIREAFMSGLTEQITTIRTRRNPLLRM